MVALKIVAYSVLLVIGALLSWVAVAVWISFAWWNFEMEFGAPEYVKSARWRLKNLSLTPMEVLSEVANIYGLVGEEKTKFVDLALGELGLKTATESAA